MDEEKEEQDDQAKDEGRSVSGEREAMFEKQLTPSDVGKLNRLVIPKLHAVNYFPIISNYPGKKVATLSFEDESGKSWRFRYSYWTSSQSYVLTQGWSRFVREKQLHAGDVVCFERHRQEFDRLFIGWRRLAASAALPESLTDAAVAAAANNSEGSTRNRKLPKGDSNSKRLRLFGVNLECQQQPHESTS